MGDSIHEPFENGLCCSFLKCFESLKFSKDGRDGLSFYFASYITLETLPTSVNVEPMWTIPCYSIQILAMYPLKTKIMLEMSINCLIYLNIAVLELTFIHIPEEP